MKGIFYKFLILLSNVFGLWIFRLISSCIAAGYFLFFPGRVAVGKQFYQVLYPDRNWPFHLLCTWKQYQNFTSVFLDRLFVRDFDEIEYTAEGWAHLESALEKKTGGILLMSHLGNWEVAAHLLKQKRDQMKLLLYMGERDKEDIEGFQKESLLKSGIQIVAVDSAGGGPLDIIEGIRFIKEGGLVSLSGDILWRKDQRRISVTFLGRKVYLPEAPYALAVFTGAPLFVFFTFRRRDNQYHFFVSEPIYIRAASRRDRPEAIQRAAQTYADLLEQTLREHPFEWYHFDAFLGAEHEKP